MSKSRRERRQARRSERKTRAATALHFFKMKSARLWIVGVLILAAVSLAGMVSLRNSGSKQPHVSVAHPSSPPAGQAVPEKLTLGKLVDLKPDQLASVDLAEMNLLCATGLPGVGKLDLEASLKTLDEWARHVEREIAKRRHQFHRDPARYDNSENLFRMVMLVLTLKEDLMVHYDPAMMGAATKPGATEDEIRRDLSDDRFFQNAASVFLSGILSDARVGTCSSMPVLYVAIGRRLGFPLKLAATKAHLFVRWDDGRERFNIEGTGDVDSLPDDYYKKWPLPLTEEEIKSGNYLKSLSPAEELAIFLEARAHCFRANGRYADAMVALAQAYRLAPRSTNREIGLAKTAEAITADIKAPLPTVQPRDPFADVKRVEEINRANREHSRRLMTAPFPASQGSQPFPRQNSPSAPPFLPYPSSSP